MEEIGGLLREAREAQGMTLRDVERATMIRRKYLEAIEAGEFSQMPGEVQLKGFIRNYAAVVGLDPDRVMGRFREARGAAATGEGNVVDRSKTEILVVEERRSGRLIFALALIVLLAVAGALYYFTVYRGASGDSSLGSDQAVVEVEPQLRTSASPDFGGVQASLGSILGVLV